MQKLIDQDGFSGITLMAGTDQLYPYTNANLNDRCSAGLKKYAIVPG